MEILDAVIKRVLVELEVLPTPPGHQPVPWRWGKDLDGHRVVHTRACRYGSEMRPWFWAGDRYPDTRSLLDNLPPFVRPCPHCLASPH
jgi:hypothetical protein